MTIATSSFSVLFSFSPCIWFLFILAMKWPLHHKYPNIFTTFQEVIQCKEYFKDKTFRERPREEVFDAKHSVHSIERTRLGAQSECTYRIRPQQLLHYSRSKKFAFFTLWFLPFISFHTTTLWECEGNTNGYFGTTKKLPLLFLWIFSVLFSNPCWFLLLSSWIHWL